MRTEFLVWEEGDLYRNGLLKGRKGDGMIRKIERVEMGCTMERSLCD